MMKINWGTGITIFYSLFVLTFVYLVYRSTQEDLNLVVDNYYEKDLQYQSHLDKLNNANTLLEDLKIYRNKEEEYIRFSFPKDFTNIKGEILLYRASDQSKDLTTTIKLDDGNSQQISTKDLQKGYWKIKVDWEGNETAYFKSTTIQIL